MDVLTKVPVREQDAAARAKNFEEVCLGYNKEEAMEEAQRCINCKNAQCIKGCPVAIDIPAFIEQVKLGNIEQAYKIISESSALPAVCGRVCPQETQCEGKCIRGIKGDAISIGKLERFVADWAREQGIKPEASTEKNGKKVLEATGKPLISMQAGECDLIMMMLQSAGSSLFNEDGTANIVNNETLKIVMETYKGLKDAGVLTEVNSWDEYVGDFVSGNVAGTINGCWIMASIQTAEDQKGNWAITNMPSLVGASGATNYSNNGGNHEVR